MLKIASDLIARRFYPEGYHIKYSKMDLESVKRGEYHTHLSSTQEKIHQALEALNKPGRL